VKKGPRKGPFSLAAKIGVAMTNEVLCKILCHNLVILVRKRHELGFILCSGALSFRVGLFLLGKSHAAATTIAKQTGTIAV